MPQYVLLVAVEEVVAPSNRRLQGSVPIREVGGAGAEVQFLCHPIHQPFDSEQANAGSRQFERQRHSFESVDQFFDHRPIGGLDRERRVVGPGAIDEELGALGMCEGWQLIRVLSLDGQQGLARDEDP